MLAQWIIEKKRDGQELSAEEIRFFIDGYTAGTIPDYQSAALAMAILFRGMTFAEVTILTDSMMRSGDVLDLSSIKNATADKHSTGGIGDKVSLVIAPLVACCGVTVPMIAGRGLGITGGTVDKLESIPGYRTGLTVRQFIANLHKCGCSIIAQTERLAPADRKLYALRDVTGTVPSIPLISASIMSKKLAEGAANLVLDVKWGKGAFMKTREDALKLARTMVEIGKRMKRGMTAVITDMNQPLGRAAGNAVEIVESIETLKGHGPADITALTLDLSARMLVLAGKARTTGRAKELLQAKLASGAAFAKFREMVKLHGGNTAFVDNPARLPSARLKVPLPSPRSGFVQTADADAIGRACIVLGAGRKTVTDNIDFAAGITGLAKIGEQVKKGQPLAVIHANDSRRLKEAQQLLNSAFRLSAKPVPAPTLVTDEI